MRGVLQQHAYPQSNQLPAPELTQHVRKNRAIFSSMLPRESSSRETDAFLLLAVAFPFFACTDPTLASDTLQKVNNTLKGRCVCVCACAAAGLVCYGAQHTHKRARTDTSPHTCVCAVAHLVGCRHAHIHTRAQTPTLTPMYAHTSMLDLIFSAARKHPRTHAQTTDSNPHHANVCRYGFRKYLDDTADESRSSEYPVFFAIMAITEHMVDNVCIYEASGSVRS